MKFFENECFSNMNFFEYEFFSKMNLLEMNFFENDFFENEFFRKFRKISKKFKNLLCFPWIYDCVGLEGFLFNMLVRLSEW